MARLRHPGILRVMSPLEELRTQLILLTEPIEFSLADYLRAGSNHALASMSELEIKHGILQLAGALRFLHNDAGLVHRGICPHAVLVSRSGTIMIGRMAPAVLILLSLTVGFVS